MKVIKTVDYQINITCDIGDKGAVVPVGAHCSIVDNKTKEHCDMIEMPDSEKIMAIWIGIYYSYPMAKFRK